MGLLFFSAKSSSKTEILGLVDPRQSRPLPRPPGGVMAWLLSLSVIVRSSSWYHLHISTWTIRQESFKGSVWFVCRRGRTNKQVPLVKFRFWNHTIPSLNRRRCLGVFFLSRMYSLFLSIVFDVSLTRNNNTLFYGVFFTDLTITGFAISVEIFIFIL